jgi:hypothetical protein
VPVKAVHRQRVAPDFIEVEVGWRHRLRGEQKPSRERHPLPDPIAQNPLTK